VSKEKEDANLVPPRRRLLLPQTGDDENCNGVSLGVGGLIRFPEEDEEGGGQADRRAWWLVAGMMAQQVAPPAGKDNGVGASAATRLLWSPTASPFLPSHARSGGRGGRPFVKAREGALLLRRPGLRRGSRWRRPRRRRGR